MKVYIRQIVYYIALSIHVCTMYYTEKNFQVP